VDDNNQIAAWLCDCYRTQIEQYSRLLEKARRLPQAFSDGDERQVLLEAMAADMDQIAVADERAQDLSQTLAAAGYSLGRPLGELVKQKKRLLEELLQQLQLAESSAESARAKLIPQVDAQTRVRRMRQAYATSRHDA